MYMYSTYTYTYLVGQLPALVAEVGPQDQEDQANVEQSHNL